MIIYSMYWSICCWYYIYSWYKK